LLQSRSECFTAERLILVAQLISVAFNRRLAALTPVASIGAVPFAALSLKSVAAVSFPAVSFPAVSFPTVPFPTVPFAPIAAASAFVGSAPGLVAVTARTALAWAGLARSAVRGTARRRLVAGRSFVLLAEQHLA